MDIEKYYKYSNMVAVVVASFLFGICLMAELSWWYIPIVIATPTVLFLFIVLCALVWSFYLTRS